MTKHPETAKHNYLAKVAAYAATHQHVGVVHISVKHDDWCNALRQRKNGMCNCNAEIVAYDG